jgi:hypothetical protein
VSALTEARGHLRSADAMAAAATERAQSAEMVASAILKFASQSFSAARQAVVAGELAQQARIELSDRLREVEAARAEVARREREEQRLQAMMASEPLSVEEREALYLLRQKYITPATGEMRGCPVVPDDRKWWIEGLALGEKNRKDEFNLPSPKGIVAHEVRRAVISPFCSREPEPLHEVRIVKQADTSNVLPRISS